LVNNLLKMNKWTRQQIENVLENYGLNIMVRPENLSVENFVNLSNVFYNK